MSNIINSFFTSDGIPQSGLTPTVRIWEITNGANTLIVGSPNGSGSTIDEQMAEIGDGFYKYEFLPIQGYDEQRNYLVRVDGGPTLSNSERYQVAKTAITDRPENIAAAVWDEEAIEHVNGGSFGEQLNQIKATTLNLALTMNDMLILIDLLVKYETNRTRIDPIAKTLTIFDDDGTTSLRVFELMDSAGINSVDEVCERNPISATDGQPVNP